jgi:hypothetical protein
MKLFYLSFMMFVFLALPLYILDTMIFPELISLKDTYQSADQIALRAAGM